MMVGNISGYFALTQQLAQALTSSCVRALAQASSYGRGGGYTPYSTPGGTAAAYTITVAAPTARQEPLAARVDVYRLVDVPGVR